MSYENCKYLISITRIQSRFAGWVCKLYVPNLIRHPFYGLFAWMYGVKMTEAVREDFGSYINFTDFFTRTLKDG